MLRACSHPVGDVNPAARLTCKAHVSQLSPPHAPRDRLRDERLGPSSIELLGATPLSRSCSGTEFGASIRFASDSRSSMVWLSVLEGDAAGGVAPVDRK